MKNTENFYKINVDSAIKYKKIGYILFLYYFIQLDKKEKRFYMKPSSYNIIFDHKGKNLAFNTRTCALTEANTDFLNILNGCNKNNFSAENADIFKIMKSGNYIVADDFDELNHLKLINCTQKFNNQKLNLIIAPTLNCNFSCPYCFEPSFNAGIMQVDVQKAIFCMVENAARNKSNINVAWYGGEPLLAKETLFNMSEKFINICRKYGVNYKASIITNGYLIDNDVISSIIKSRILKVQITIDGPEEVHNLRRKLKYGDERGTFNKIIESIKKLISKNINISIRINIDKTNEDKIEELLKLLKLSNLDRCKIEFGHIKAYTDVCNSIVSNCFSTKEYAKLMLKYQIILNSKNFSVSSYLIYPKIKTNYCCAGSAFSFVIDPRGNMYKCCHDIGDTSKKVGNVIELRETNNLYINNLHAKYMFWSPFKYDKCKNCSILPICMGGCPNEGLKQKKPECEQWKYNLLEVLKFAYEKSIEELTICKEKIES